MSRRKLDHYAEAYERFWRDGAEKVIALMGTYSAGNRYVALPGAHLFTRLKVRYWNWKIRRDRPNQPNWLLDNEVNERVRRATRT